MAPADLAFAKMRVATREHSKGEIDLTNCAQKEALVECRARHTSKAAPVVRGARAGYACLRGLELAREMPQALERNNALKIASRLHCCADAQSIVFAKRGRPRTAAR